jgi:hypothetical protein
LWQLTQYVRKIGAISVEYGTLSAAGAMTPVTASKIPVKHLIIEFLNIGWTLFCANLRRGFQRSRERQKNFIDCGPNSRNVQVPRPNSAAGHESLRLRIVHEHSVSVGRRRHCDGKLITLPVLKNRLFLVPEFDGENSMIAPTDQSACDGVPELDVKPPDFLVLARYGRVPQVARFAGFGSPITRETAVVVTTERGQELANVLQILPVAFQAADGSAVNLTGEVLRVATAADLSASAASEEQTETSYSQWQARAAAWKLQLELIDIEQTLDHRLILYVLNDRGAETTRLALLAAAAGFGVVHVQPVSAEGVVQASGGGGCGSCGTHAH